MPSTSHQFCTPWLQLTPSTWHAGCRILQRPFRWLAEEQSRLWNRLLRASAIGPDDLLAVGAKDQAVGRLRATSRERGSITAFLGRYSARNPDYPQSIFNPRRRLNRCFRRRAIQNISVRRPPANHFRRSAKYVHQSHVAISASSATHTATQTAQHGQPAHPARFGTLPSGGAPVDEDASSYGASQSEVAVGAE